MSRAAVIFRSLALTLVLGTTCAAVPGMASAASKKGHAKKSRPSTTCTAPTLAQTFSWASDNHMYAALPGESWDNMGDGTSWSLTSGATFQSVALLDGSTGPALDLPSGSQAITPPVCLSHDYPSARAEIQNVTGSRGVNVYVSYATANGWARPKFVTHLMGRGTGWTLSRRFAIDRGSLHGWNLARFVLAPRGPSGEYQVSNFFVDPRMHK